jgi:lysophospholipase L1-like esterase
MVFSPLLMVLAATCLQAPKEFEFRDNDRVVWIGNTLVEREQRYGFWESAVLAANRDKKITWRNLGWSGDTVFGEARAGFDNAAKGFERLVSLTLELKPTVIVISYGANESFEGVEGLTKFEKGLEKLLEALKPARARIVLCSPLPVASTALHAEERNKLLARYGEAIGVLAKKHACFFADLTPLIHTDEIALMDNGIHLNEAGYRVTAPRFLKSLGMEASSPDSEQLEHLRQAVIEKNQLFFYRWRPQNETYLFGFRKHEQGKNAKEVAEFDPLVGKVEEEIDRLRQHGK